MFSGMNADIAKYMMDERILRARQDGRARAAVRARKERKAREAERAAQLAAAVAPAPVWTPPVRELAEITSASPAVRVGPFVEVGATTATAPDGSVLYAGDPYRQAREAFLAVGESLRKAGAGLDDVVRTRVYLKRSWHWKDAGRAHGEIFGSTKPVTTFVGAGGFVDSGILVAVEATAVVDH